MRFSSFLWSAAPLALALLLPACQSNSTDQPATAPPETAATADRPTNDADAWYRQYRGLLPGQPDSVTLHLQRLGPDTETATTTPGGRLVGFYTAADGRPYEVLGNATPDSLHLRDTSREPAADEATLETGPEWQLQVRGATLVGTHRGQKVQLRQLVRPEGVQFAMRRFAATVVPRPSHPTDSVSGHSVLWALVPFRAPHQQELAAHLRRGLLGDSTGMVAAPPLDSIWQQRLRAFTTDYRTDVTPLLAAADQAAPDDDYRPRATLGYEQELGTNVLWNAGNLLSIGYLSYEFSGGAHGNYGTTVRSYDTRTGRQLRYPDIFRPTAGPRLVALLGQYIRPVMGLESTAPLAGVLLVPTLPVTRNVYLTSGGAVFVYQPYEIAAYAYGEISVFVPFSALDGLLQPGLPVAAGPALAGR